MKKIVLVTVGAVALAMTLSTLSIRPASAAMIACQFIKDETARKKCEEAAVLGCRINLIACGAAARRGTTSGARGAAQRGVHQGHRLERR